LSQRGHLLITFFRIFLGDTSFGIGYIEASSVDSVEEGSWMYVKADTFSAYFGKFSSGVPVNEWQIAFKDGWHYTSNWNVYINRLLHCKFSLPFGYEEVMPDSNSLRLATNNDSLGTVWIMVSSNPQISDASGLARYGVINEQGLLRQGLTFTKRGRQIRNKQAAYFFTEYFMKTPLNKSVKYYHFYGNLPSQKKLIEISVYHDRPKEELIKVLLKLILTICISRMSGFITPI
jgi:hypothetical protein